jgi:hypothetical protein
MKTIQEYKQAITDAKTYDELLALTQEIDRFKNTGEMENWDWWMLYMQSSPKLTRLFKETETGRQMMKRLNMSPNSVLGSVESDTVATIPIFEKDEMVCGNCGEEVVAKGNGFKCVACGTMSFPVAVNQAVINGELMEFSSTFLNPVF